MRLWADEFLVLLVLGCIPLMRNVSSFAAETFQATYSSPDRSRKVLRGSSERIGFADMGALIEDAVDFRRSLHKGPPLGPLIPNPGPIPLAGHFTLVLEQALARLDKHQDGDRSVGQYIAHCTDEFVTFHDGYPKAAIHLLVLPRRVRVAGLGQLTAGDLPMLRRLGAYVSWVLQAAEGQKGDPGLGWVHGVHAVPSLRQLHVHIMTQDLCSPCMKNAKHFSSFRPPFLVALDDIIDTLEQGGDLSGRFNLRTAEEDMKRRSLCCHRCGLDFGRKFAELKRHLLACAAPPRAPWPPPMRWNLSSDPDVIEDSTAASRGNKKRGRDSGGDTEDEVIDIT
eukprot:TRINITY_DN103972_c0_g1_i1.p1 TRINITY_DN103972_c0_g1~~TRINITY_DN103972_c0_g1_i1.p1  ORF type:complete len:383 (-),score=35.85 TRINITY_DN103972_c0_g1_i1:106-1119(-)